MDYEVYEEINRWIIPAMWVMVGVSLLALIVVCILVIVFDKRVTKGSEANFKKLMYGLIVVLYNTFIVLISLFPLAGMLGTVSALVTLDISGATDALKDNFFQALDTTGMGLICAIVFKLVNAVFQPHIEDCIAKAKRLLEKGDENE